MINTTSNIEIMAPVGCWESLAAAIQAGATSVYFGIEHLNMRARSSANFTTEDMHKIVGICREAGVKTYLTLNTVMYPEDLPLMREIVDNAKAAGVSAIIASDIAAMQYANQQGVEVHLSTQLNIANTEALRFYAQFADVVVLARELSIDEIRQIHESVPDVELEVFVHGALCVSYSGLCYASQYCFGRSANRGECAQFCRLSFDMVDSEGKIMEKSRHLLSLKDMKQIDNIEALAEAGATSFKIEGRLKDMVYVKNVTAAYSQRLDSLVARYPDRYCRASLGHSTHMFTPNLSKTFNRGFTTYFASGRRPDISSPDTPKALGEYVGKVKEIRGQWFTVAGLSAFANGDGLCFINDERQLEGFRVNKVENNRLFPLKMPAGMRKGTALYRNNDQEFERQLSRQSAERKISVFFKLCADGNILTLSVQTEGFSGIAEESDIQLQKAEKPQHDNIVRQLSKLGGTSFVCAGVDIPDSFDCFIPSSILAKMRRQAIEQLEGKIRHNERPVNKVRVGDNVPHLYPSRYTYLYNIANSKSREFYLAHGLRAFDLAFEKSAPAEGIVMQCRYCLRYALGYCVKRGGSPSPYREPYFLCLPDGRRFRLQFDCAKCQMNVCYDEN